MGTPLPRHAGQPRALLEERRSPTAWLASVSLGESRGEAAEVAKGKIKDQIAVDFDGRLTDSNAKGVKDPAELPPPLDGARDFLARLMAKGKRVTILTHRDTAHVEKWLELHGLTEMVPGGVTNHKPEAAAYLDDRAVRFDGDFKKALKDLTSRKRSRPWWKTGGALGL